MKSTRFSASAKWCQNPIWHSVPEVPLKGHTTSGTPFSDKCQKPTLAPHRQPSERELTALFIETNRTMRTGYHRRWREIMVNEQRTWRYWMNPAQVQIVAQARRLGLNRGCPQFLQIR
jgi:hypothetical protein